MICNSIKTNVFPQCFKHSLIIPILKKPRLDLNNLLNYRPISQLPVISKIREKIICKQITNYLTQHNLNDPNQHAFRPKHSTERVLNMLNDVILKPLDDGLITQLLLLELSSAFDAISHEIILTRLNDEGITDNAFDFIKRYITQRSYSVLIGNEISVRAC